MNAPYDLRYSQLRGGVLLIIVSGVCKPSSVLDDHLSGPAVASRLKRLPVSATGRRRSEPRGIAAHASLSILHQVGFTARTSRQAAGELLPRLSILTSSIGRGGISLLHSPWSRLHRPLGGTLPCGARTFLMPRRARDRLVTSHRGMITQETAKVNEKTRFPLRKRVLT